MAMGAAGILLPAPSIPSSHSSRFRLPQTPWAVGLRTPPQQWPRPHLHFVSHHFPPSRHLLLLLLRRRRTGKRGGWRGKAVYASLFGVGAPEALVIGVVALLVFGPKGLAEVARNLGKTLRAFQPTIRELQDVSREFKSTLEREIGLDEVPPSTNYRPTPTDNSQQPAVNQNAKPETAPYSSDELLKVTEEQLAASAAAAWKTQPPVSSEPQEAASTSETETKTKTGTKTEGTSSLGAGDAPASASESDPSPNTTIQ